MNTLGYFEIQSSNPEREIDFYATVFDWSFDRDESVPIEYYRLIGAGVQGALLKRPVKVPPKEHGTNAFTCSFQVKNFDKTAQTILDKGGQVAMPKFAIPGRCWQGYFLDADQNVFGIFEMDEDAF
ncbi:VOC family protein [Flagellimonas lutaonensis]|uniref:Lactoylglutathione lyase n=1 Tax=Flagellimonas lutaonensis TaxID=516051 RepID=A0A0D5YRK4_9FLAO|nr:VOC family protein [Allomuricauda lutaonensis]AKA34524.1 Lactoylglutathione lyase [Allomuricauda lutaonensis]